jgi:hypothetical protein
MFQAFVIWRHRLINGFHETEASLVLLPLGWLPFAGVTGGGRTNPLRHQSAAR